MEHSLRASREAERPDPEAALLPLIGQMPIVALATDRDLRVLWTTGAGFRSVAPDVMVGRDLRDILRGTDNFEEAIAGHMAALAGRNTTHENALLGFAAEVRVAPWRDEEGRIVGTLAIAVDVSEREQIAVALRHNRRLLLDAEALAHVGTWEHDFETGRVYSSEENRRLFFGDDRSKGENNDDYIAAIHPADRERVLDRHDQMMADSRSPSIEYRVVWPDGSVHWILGHKRIVRDASGKPLRQFGTNLDITDRKQAEAELDRRLRQQAMVAELGLRALRGGDLQALFDATVTAMSEDGEIDLAAVMEQLPDGTLLMRAGFGWGPGLVGTAIPAENQCGYALEHGEPSVVSDLALEKRFGVTPILLDRGVRSGVSALIQGADGPWGTLAVHTRKARAWSRHDLNFVQSVANVLATALARERAGEELATKRELLQSLSRKLLEAQEAERRAIARELHDDFGQVLTAIGLDLRKDGCSPASIQLVDEAIQRVRELAQDLRPAILDDLGLPAAIQWYVTREAKRAGLEPELALADLQRLPPTVETTCFRLVQEALTNIIRHAHARHVYVGLAERDRGLHLTVRDDGKGFDTRAALRRATQGHSLGLLGMKERVSLAGGELAIHSVPGRGTSVHARLPLHQGAHDGDSNAAGR